MHRSVLTALAVAAVCQTAIPAQAADTTPEQARALETQLRAWMVGLLGPDVRVSDRPVQFAPDGEKFRVSAPIIVTRDNKPETLTVMASARQIEGGRWAVDGLRLPLPARFTIMMQPPAEGQKTPALPFPVNYTVTATGQDGNAVWDPSFAAPSTFSYNLSGVRVEATGNKLRQVTEIGRSVSTTTLRPSGSGRVDVVSDTTTESYMLASKTGDLDEIKVSAQRGRSSGNLTSVSRDRATQVLQAFIRIGTVAAAAAPKAGEKAPATPAPMDVAGLRTLLQAMDGLTSEFTLDQTIDDVVMSYGAMGGKASQVSIGMGAKTTAEGIVEAHMDLGMDGLALPDLALGPMADLIPRRVALRPVISGVAAKDLLDFTQAAIEAKNGNPPPAAVAKLFSRGGVSTGLESFLLDIAGTTFSGMATVLVPSPDQVSGTGQITAINFDALMAKANSTPQLAQAVPVFTFAKGLGRNVDNKLVWDVSYKDGKVVVNGTDLSAMMGGGRK